MALCSHANAGQPPSDTSPPRALWRKLCPRVERFLLPAHPPGPVRTCHSAPQSSPGLELRVVSSLVEALAFSGLSTFQAGFLSEAAPVCGDRKDTATLHPGFEVRSVVDFPLPDSSSARCRTIGAPLYGRSRNSRQSRYRDRPRCLASPGSEHPAARRHRCAAAHPCCGTSSTRITGAGIAPSIQPGASTCPCNLRYRAHPGVGPAEHGPRHGFSKRAPIPAKSLHGNDPR